MEDVESRMYSSRASVWVERRRMGFVVMGLEVEDNVSRANGVEHAAYGMLVYDGEKKEWRNETGPHIMTENSHLVHLEAGKDDLLITLGEEEPSDDTGVSEFRLVSLLSHLLFPSLKLTLPFVAYYANCPHLLH